MMPMKLTGFTKRYSDDNWFRKPSRDEGPSPASMWIGHRAKCGAISLGAEERHRFSKDAVQNRYNAPGLSRRFHEKVAQYSPFCCVHGPSAHKRLLNLSSNMLFAWARNTVGRDSRRLVFQS